MTHRSSFRRSSLEELPKIQQQYPIKGISMCQQREEHFLSKPGAEVNHKEQSAQQEQTQQLQYQSFSPFRSISRDHQDNSYNININHRSIPTIECLQQSQHQSSSLKKPVPIIRRFSSTGLPPPQHSQFSQLPEQNRQSSQIIPIITNTSPSRNIQNNQHNQQNYQTTSQQQHYSQQVYQQQPQMNYPNQIDYLTQRDTKFSNNHLVMDQAMTVRTDINGGKKYRSFSQTAITTTTTATPTLEQYQQQPPLILLGEISTPHSDSAKPQLIQQTIHRQITQQTKLMNEQQNYQGGQCSNMSNYQVKQFYLSKPSQENQVSCLTAADLPLIPTNINHNKSIYQTYDNSNYINNIPNSIPCSNNISTSQNDRPISTIASYDDISHSCEIPQLDLHRIPSFSFFPQETTKRSKKDERDNGEEQEEDDLLEVYEYKRQSMRSSCSQIGIIQQPLSSENTSLMPNQNLRSLKDNNNKSNIKKVVCSDESICSAQSIGDTAATIRRITNHSRIRQKHELFDDDDNDTKCSQQQEQQYEHVILPTTEGSVQEQSKQLSSYDKEIVSSQDTVDICVTSAIISKLEQQKIKDNEYDQEFTQVRENISNIINNSSSNIQQITVEKENINSSSKNNKSLSNVQRLMGQIKRIPVKDTTTTSNRDNNQEQNILQQQHQQQRQSQPTAVEQLYSKLQSLNNSYLRLSSQIQASIKQQTNTPSNP